MAERIWSASAPARLSASSSSRSVSSLMIAVKVWNVSHTKHRPTSLTASTERLQQSHVCSSAIGLPFFREQSVTGLHDLDRFIDVLACGLERGKLCCRMLKDTVGIHTRFVDFGE